MTGKRQKTAPPPLDSTKLEQLALHYAARYATTRARLKDYLRRKLRERGWTGDEPPPIEALVSRLADLRYVDDSAFAAARGASLGRRGYGQRRIDQSLTAAGVAGDDRAAAILSATEAWEAADRLARKRRWGPYADRPADPAERQRRIATFVRAGHSFATAAIWVDATAD
jgi:regulatory protein